MGTNRENFPSIDAASLSEVRQILVLDIRPYEERRGEMGFVPGSRSVDADRFARSPFEVYERLGEPQLVGLMCLSGRRSGELTEQLIREGLSGVYNIEGGLLGWRAEGLPTCGVSDVDTSHVPEIASIEEFPRALTSCFLAESVEIMLESGDDSFDPIAAVDDIIAEERARAGGELTPRALNDVVERLSVLAWQQGHPLANIARNVDAMLHVIDQVARF